ncbi:hypothetical protein [Streptomyces sp. YIM 121038]|nr:hypothetical protein [Streptomyces sp. YIM 121038]
MAAGEGPARAGQAMEVDIEGVGVPADPVTAESVLSAPGPA